MESRATSRELDERDRTASFYSPERSPTAATRTTVPRAASRHTPKGYVSGSSPCGVRDDRSGSTARVSSNHTYSSN